MKKLKKFALLLVGVMALALLTACGGGGSGEDAPAEASVMTAIDRQTHGGGETGQRCRAQSGCKPEH